MALFSAGHDLEALSPERLQTCSQHTSRLPSLQGRRCGLRATFRIGRSSPVQVTAETLEENEIVLVDRRVGAPGRKRVREDGRDGSVFLNTKRLSRLLPTIS